jgi:hypothetical protein
MSFFFLLEVVLYEYTANIYCFGHEIQNQVGHLLDDCVNFTPTVNFSKNMCDL